MFGDYADNVYNRLVKEKGMKSIETIKCNSIFYTEYVLKNSVFIPFLKGSHYLLIMLNISEETFTLFDRSYTLFKKWTTQVSMIDHSLGNTS